MVKTNDRGEFNSPFMRVGEYIITAEAPGFKKRVVNGIILQVDQTANLQLQLEVGQVNESVEVTAAARCSTPRHHRSDRSSRIRRFWSCR